MAGPTSGVSPRWWVGVVLAAIGLGAVAFSLTLAGPGLVAEDPRAADDPGETVYVGPNGSVTSTAIEEAIVDELAEVRETHGLESLATNETVASVARAHSHDMANRDYVAHESPEGEDPIDRFEAVADFCTLYGETIAQTWIDRPVQSHESDEPVTHEDAQDVAAAIVTEWMASEPHRETILERNETRSWTTAGIGVYLSEDGTVTATANFCHEP